MTARRRGACAVVVAVSVYTGHAQGPAAVDPPGLLATLPARVERGVLPIQGVLAAARSVDRWRLRVNDAALFESEPGSARLATPIRLGIVLRPGDNLITLEAIVAGKVGIPVERWSTHVHRTDPEPTQFALLAAGDSSRQTTGQVDSVMAALVASGVRAENIVTVSDAAKFEAELSELGAKTRGRDQVLIYYSGLGRVRATNSEPELLFQRDTPVPVGNVVRGASDLPGTSLLLDIAYTDPSSPSGGPVKAATRIAPNARWLGTISDAPIEVAYTNPSAGDTRSAVGFTEDFVREWQDGSDGQCKTFARIAQSVAATNAQKAAAWPVFFTHGDSSFLFCPAQTALAQPQLSIRAIPDAEMVPPFKFVDVSLPGRAIAAELNVDGVPLPIPSSAASKSEVLRVPIGPGLHVIEARAMGAGDAAVLIGKAGCAGPSSAGVVCAPSTVSSERWSPNLVARLEPGLLPQLTSETSVAMRFVVGGGAAKDIRYQVRNNGVVVRQEAVKLSEHVQRRQIMQRIPLIVGTNNLALDVIDGTAFTSSRITVERRRSQAVRAVIVGVDAPAGAPPLAGATIDARRVYDLLLGYSDASPRDLELLTGAAATRQAVLRAMARFAESPDTMPRSRDDDSTFLLYFAGYGLSFPNPKGGVTRCLVTGGFDPTGPSETCLSTDDVAASLDQVGHAIVMVDTSYDGPAGPGSRTYSSFQTTDTTWRLTSGIDRPDRVFLVASGSNSAAYETSDGGLFTQALADVVRTRLDGPAGGEPRELSLLDAYDRARDATSAKSGRKQVPVMKGVLSAAFHFVPKDTATLVPEANSIERAARNDLVAMRPLNRARLARAEALYEKALAVNSGDIRARLGLARVQVLKGELTTASETLEHARGLLATPSAEHAEWLSISADIKMRRGDPTAALADAQAAAGSDPRSQTVAAQLALLHGIAGHYDRSFAALQPLLLPAAAQDSTLTEEEQGRLVIHTYLALRQMGRRNDATLLLRSYFASLSGNPWFKTVYQLFSGKDRIVELGQVGVQTPWSHLIAQFFFDSQKYEGPLTSFLADTEPFDPRDPSAFDCLLQFYRGMFYSLNQNRPAADQAFETAVATGKTAYAEYWMARAQLNRTRN
jgi:hypothetical protein